jgi:hypothetical protein
MNGARPRRKIPRFQVGQRVIHAEHGQGRVVSCDPNETVVAYPDGHRRVKTGDLLPRAKGSKGGLARHSRRSGITWAAAFQEPAPPAPATERRRPIPDGLIPDLEAAGLLVEREPARVAIRTPDSRHDLLMTITGRPGAWEAVPSIDANVVRRAHYRKAVDELNAMIAANLTVIQQKGRIEVLVRLLASCPARLAEAREGAAVTDPPSTVRRTRSGFRLPGDGTTLLRMEASE